MTAYIKGQPQEVQYGLTGRNVFFEPREIDGSLISPVNSPIVVVYNPDGSQIATGTATNLTVDEYNGVGHFTYYVPSPGTFSDLNHGATITGATTGATARIVRIIKTAATRGIVSVDNVMGAFNGSENISDDGDTPGLVGMTTLVLSPLWLYQPATTTTGTYPIGENYRIEFSYGYRFNGSAHSRKDTVYFDVVATPFDALVTTEDVNALHPDWANIHPDGSNAGWDEAIKAAHAELAIRIRALGNRPNLFVRREELYPIEMAMVEAQIAKRLTNMPAETRSFWIQQASERWEARGEFAYAIDDDGDGDVDDVGVAVISSRFTL